MATIQRFEDLEIWQKARVLANEVYELTFKDPILHYYRIRDRMGAQLEASWTISQKDLNDQADLNL